MTRSLTLTILSATAIFGMILYSEAIVRPPLKDDRTHIVYWEKWTSFEGDAIRDTVDYFNKSQNKIYVDLLTVSAIEKKVLLATAGGDPPDLAGLFAPQVAQYADDNALMPLNELCREAGIKKEDYIPCYWECCIIGDKIIALPTTPADTALIINKTMLKEAGLDPNRAPKTVEELDHYCDLITKRMPDGRLERVGFIPSEPGWWNWAWGGMFGGKVWDGGTKIRANSKENVRAFTWIQSFAKKYGGSNIQAFKSGLGKFSAPENGFFSNKVAMEIQGNWMFNFIKKYAPQMEHPTRTWMVAPTPYPADRPDLVNNTIVDLDIIGIPRGAKHPKEAFEFIKFLQSVKGMEMLCLKHGKHTPLMKTSLGYFETHPNPDVRLFADLAQGKATVSPPKLGIWPEYKDALGAAFDEVILDKRSPQEALNAVQDRMQAKLDQYLKRKRLRGELR